MKTRKEYWIEYKKKKGLAPGEGELIIARNAFDAGWGFCQEELGSELIRVSDKLRKELKSNFKQAIDEVIDEIADEFPNEDIEVFGEVDS